MRWDAMGCDEMGWDGMPNSQPCKAPRHCVPQNAPWPKIRAGAPQVAACPSPVVVGLSGDIWRGHQRRARGWGTACKKDASFYSQAGAVWCCVSVWDTTGSPSTPPCRCLPLSAHLSSCLELCRYGHGGFGVSAVPGAALQGHRESPAGGCGAELWDGAMCVPRAGRTPLQCWEMCLRAAGADLSGMRQPRPHTLMVGAQLWSHSSLNAPAAQLRAGKAKGVKQGHPCSAATGCLQNTLGGMGLPLQLPPVWCPGPWESCPRSARGSGHMATWAAQWHWGGSERPRLCCLSCLWLLQSCSTWGAESRPRWMPPQPCTFLCPPGPTGPVPVFPCGAPALRLGIGRSLGSQHSPAGATFVPPAPCPGFGHTVPGLVSPLHPSLWSPAPETPTNPPTGRGAPSLPRGMRAPACSCPCEGGGAGWCCTPIPVPDCSTVQCKHCVDTAWCWGCTVSHHSCGKEGALAGPGVG